MRRRSIVWRGPTLFSLSIRWLREVRISFISTWVVSISSCAASLLPSPFLMCRNSGSFAPIRLAQAFS